jgi:hypothetical protein
MTTDKDHGIFIRQHEGFRIYYEFRKFKAIKGEVEIEAPTEDELVDLIKKHNAESRRFKPIDVIKVDDCKKGRITSRVAENDKEVYFSFEADKEKKHTKERLMSYDWENRDKKYSYFVEATPKNLQILADIEKENEAILSCYRAIEQLKKKFEKPVSWETVEKAAGEKQ